MFRSVEPNSSRYLVIPALAVIGLLTLAAAQSPAGESDGVRVPDADLVLRAQAQLDQLPEIDRAGVQVAARQGEIWLSGEVEDFDTWERVHQAVRGVEGATRLLSELKIRARHLIPRASDEQIVAAVKSKLEANRIGPAIEIESRGGAVTLTGRVDSASARKLAGLLAHSTASVRTVDNRLAVAGA